MFLLVGTKTTAITPVRSVNEPPPRVFPGARQRSIGPPTCAVLGLKSSSHCWLFAVSDDSAVTTTTAATAFINITDHQPLGQLCRFLPAAADWISRGFTDGEEVIFNNLIE